MPLLQRIPALGFQFELLAIAGDEGTAKLWLGDVAYQTNAFDVLHTLMIGYGHGEEQLIVFASIQGTGGEVHVELLSHHGCLIVYGDMLLIDSAASMTLLADMHQF